VLPWRNIKGERGKRGVPHITTGSKEKGGGGRRGGLNFRALAKGKGGEDAGQHSPSKKERESQENHDRLSRKRGNNSGGNGSDQGGTGLSQRTGRKKQVYFLSQERKGKSWSTLQAKPKHPNKGIGECLLPSATGAVVHHQEGPAKRKIDGTEKNTNAVER